ncbi:NACHT domain-containing protein [Actinoplanes sp. NPDC049265]|uniref:NACHT domain-containing protein n=1 Tax=Actinoplanes sp. NPDC049265 TaxID=3363902 RepID=UPI0037124CA1
MGRRLRYADAVRLLGGTGPAAAGVENLLGTALSLATAGGSEVALSLFDAKTEMVRLGRVAAGQLRDKWSGYGRYERNLRLEAAHGVLVVIAFFEAFDEIVTAADFPAPELSRDDQVLLAARTPLHGDWLHSLLETPLPVPAAERGYHQLLDELATWYAGTGDWFVGFLEGLAEWDRADERARGAVTRLMRERLPHRAVQHYEEGHRRLAVDVPEFAIWVDRAESRAVGRGLAELEAILRRTTAGAGPERHRAALASAYRAELDRPILGRDTADPGDAGGLTIPLLGEAYVDARFRARECGPGSKPGDEDWWAAATPRDDLSGFLVRYLITPQATVAPLLLLGQPGAGKSALTRILAARLPASDFLAVRVVLREVPAEAPIQDQIEYALRAAIHESVAWAELSRTAGGALPVVMLDGFDELLQATGVHRSDYLERVAEFQRAEAVQGRSVAVIVTSRLAVADRARLAEDGVAVRLEPFDDAQVGRWLDTWNTANRAALGRRGLRTLPKEVVGRFPDLARQPLLLLMLALYDASGNALQNAGATFGTAQLYDRLLHDFAVREVRRWHQERPDHELAGLVADELMRLSIVAFAMFNRGRQWVTERELDDDLTGLRVEPARRGPAEDFRSPLTAGQEVVGRFFFIQRAQATQDGRALQTYEFLHATFGEYLVARLLAGILRENAARETSRVVRLGAGGGGDEELLRGLLGFTPLTARNTVLSFVADMLATSGPGPVHAWLIGRLQAAVFRPEASPRAYGNLPKRADHWMSIYSLNLVLLALACGEPVRASEVWTLAQEPARWLQGLSLGWQAAVPPSSWFEVTAHLDVRRTYAPDGRNDIVLGRYTGEPVEKVDPLWSFRTDGSAPFETAYEMDEALRSMHLSNHLSEDVFRHAVEPLLDHMPRAVTHFFAHGPGDAESVAHSLLSLLMVSAADEEPGLPRAYDRAVAVLTQFVALVEDPTNEVILLLRTMRQDAGRLGPARVAHYCRRIAETGIHSLTVVRAIRKCLTAGDVPADEADRIEETLVQRVQF